MTKQEIMEKYDMNELQYSLNFPSPDLLEKQGTLTPDEFMRITYNQLTIIQKSTDDENIIHDLEQLKYGIELHLEEGTGNIFK